MNKAFQLVSDSVTLGNSHKHNLGDTIQISTMLGDLYQVFSKGTITTVPDPLEIISRSFNKPQTLFIVASIVINIKPKKLSNKSVIRSIIRKGQGLEIRSSLSYILRSELGTAICFAILLFSTDFDKGGGFFALERTLDRRSQKDRHCLY